MISQEFEYFAPSTLQDALKLLADPGAKALAGGMSLIPLMKLRLAAPEKLVDLRGVPELHSIQREGGFLRVGSMVTHYEIESSPLVREVCPLLAATAASIGDVQIRNAGTLGGSVAHADPAADYPAGLLALEATLRICGPNGDREMPIEQFLVDTFTTALEPGELIASIVIPVEEPGTGVYYQKHPQPASGFPMVGVAARIRRQNGSIHFARVGVTGLAEKGYRARNVEEHITGKVGSMDEVKEAAALVANGVTANADIHASGPYRTHLACVAATRAIVAALQRAS